MAVTCDSLDILNFLKKDFVKRVFEYFGFPFDATPRGASALCPLSARRRNEKTN